jgi:hypothetical protein
MDITDLALATVTYKGWRDKDTSFWDDSLFETYKYFPPPTKGSQAERLVADLLERLGSSVPRKRDGSPQKPKGSSSDFDLYIDELKVEVKASTAWDGVIDSFTWQQIRSEQEYDRVVFVGVNPNQVCAWWCTKADLDRHVFGRDEYRQHAGRNGNQELYWIKTSPDGDPSTAPPVLHWFRDVQTWND